MVKKLNMKNVLPYLMFLLINCLSLSAYAQSNDEPVALGLPGDNLNLYAVLDVFQKSKTLEDFEKSINDEGGKINNLDLNNDNTIDYIQVVSEKNAEGFFVILQVAVSATEKQDIAVVEVTKDKKGQVLVQIIGDEELYGKDYIVEPAEVAKLSATPNPGYKGEGTVIINNNNTTNNYNTDNGPSISAWPVVLYMFSPLFTPWRSPWYWGYYPPYWRPWRPVYYYNYWGYHRSYYHNPYYRRTVIIRYPGHRVYYSNRRATSIIVINNRMRGSYRTTYNGRTYSKPAPPLDRPSTNRPVTRPSTPTTRPITRPTSPTTRPTSPTTRPTSPTTRPTTRPTSPTTRPVSRPVTRPVARPTSGSVSNRVSRN